MSLLLQQISKNDLRINGTTHATLSILIKAVSPRWELSWTRHHRDRAVQRGTVDLPRPHSWSVDQGGL